MPARTSRCAAALVLLAVCQFSAFARADDVIEGVQPAALDQPRVVLEIRRTAAGAPLRSATGGAEETLEAFLDTGASSVVLSKATADALKITEQTGRDGKPAKFYDVGVAGADEFHITEPLFFSVQSESAGKPAAVGPFRAQIRPNGGILEMIAPGMDIAGMPVMVGKVAVIDPAPLKNFDKLRTLLLRPDDRAIPKVSRHIELTGVSFGRFTRVDPAGAEWPAIMANPMIGPDPFK